MKTFRVLKSYYGSVILEVEAEDEQQALELAKEIEIDLDENLGAVDLELVV